MSIVVSLFGIFFAILGVSGLIFHSSIIAFVSRWQTQAGLYLAAIIRIVLGVALLFTASASRAPIYLRILGVVAVVAGVHGEFLIIAAILGFLISLEFLDRTACDSSRSCIEDDPKIRWTGTPM